MAPKKRKAAGDGGNGGDRDSSAPKKAKRNTNTNSTALTRITRGMTIDAPRKAVLNTTKLLETILIYLPAKQVFVVQRVSRQFRELVQNSVKIQQKLFLRLSGATPQPWVVQKYTEPSPSSFRGFKPKARFVRYEGIESPQRENELWFAATLNPLLNEYPQRVALTLNQDTRQTMKIGLRQGWQGLTAPISLRDTFLTDPPCQSASMYVSWTVRTKPISRGVVDANVEDPNGVTFGALFDAVLNEPSYAYWAKGNWRREEEEGTLGEVLKVLEEEAGRRAEIRYSTVSMDDGIIMVPTKQEWQEMEQSLFG